MHTKVRTAPARHAPLYAAVACIVFLPALLARAQAGADDEEAWSELEIGLEGGGGTYGWTGSCTSGTVSYGGLAGTVRYRHSSGASVTALGGGGVRTSNDVSWTPTWGAGLLGGYRGRYVGFEGGFLLFSNGLTRRGVDSLPAVRLRIGRLDNYHFRAGFADQVPVQRGSLWFENAVGGLGPMTIALGVSMLPQVSFAGESRETTSLSPYARIEGEIDGRFFMGASFYLSVTNGAEPQAFATLGVRL